MDLILQLRTEIKNRSGYDKVFAKVWGASGKYDYCFPNIINYYRYGRINSIVCC